MARLFDDLHYNRLCESERRPGKEKSFISLICTVWCILKREIKSHAPHQILITKLWPGNDATQFSLCERYNFVLSKGLGHDKDQKNQELWPCQKNSILSHTNG
jgi:hypothetical protein